MKLTNKKILISGGGIAGCTLSYFLKRHGFNPVIVEAAPEFKHIGYLLALNQQIGQKVAKKMGILEELKKFELPLGKNVFYDMSGILIKQYELDYETYDRMHGLNINRADLHSVLYDKVKNDVDFHFGQQITSINQSDEGVGVTFSNGKKEKFDLLIGADGMHSKTRELVFGTSFEKYLGQAYFAFTVPNRTNVQVAENNQLVSIRGKDFMISYHVNQQKDIGCYTFHSDSDLKIIEPKQRRAYMLEKYAPYDTKLKNILESMTDDDFIFHDGFTQIIMPSWSKGGVCLIGDAAHCPTPASGVGGTMAMAGAYILAKKLSETDDYQAAFMAYESYLRPTIEKVQKSAAVASKFVGGKSFISYDLTNTLLKVLPVPLLSKVHSHVVEMPLS